MDLIACQLRTRPRRPVGPGAQSSPIDSSTRSACGHPRKCSARREPQRHERLLSAAVILCVEVLSASAVESDDDARCSELLKRSSWRRIDHDEVSDEIRRSARLELLAERIDHVPPDLDRPPTRRIVGVIGLIDSDSDANEAPPTLDCEGYDAQRIRRRLTGVESNDVVGDRSTSAPPGSLEPTHDSAPSLPVGIKQIKAGHG